MGSHLPLSFFFCKGQVYVILGYVIALLLGLFLEGPQKFHLSIWQYAWTGKPVQAEDLAAGCENGLLHVLEVPRKLRKGIPGEAKRVMEILKLS